MHLVVVKRPVVRHDHQQRNAVVCRSPQRRDAHQEIAVPQHRDRQPVRPGQCQSRPHRDPRPRAKTGASGLTQMVQWVPQWPDRRVPGQRQVQQRYRPLTHRHPQIMRQPPDRDHPVMRALIQAPPALETGRNHGCRWCETCNANPGSPAGMLKQRRRAQWRLPPQYFTVADFQRQKNRGRGPVRAPRTELEISDAVARGIAEQGGRANLRCYPADE